MLEARQLARRLQPSPQALLHQPPSRLTRRLPRFTPIQGQLTPLTDAGLAGGWTATVSPFDVPPAVQPGIAILERVECEVWWMDGDRRRSFKVEGYKRSILQPTDVIGGVIQP